MYMRFRLPYETGRPGEIRFAFSRRTTNGVERVRLLRASVQWAANDAERLLLQVAAERVLSTVALPRRRTSTENTLVQIAAVLGGATGNAGWHCVNTSRVTRRRRVRIQPPYRTQIRWSEDSPNYRHHIHSYSHKPLPRFRVGGGEDSEARAFFGIELEIDQRNGGQLDPGMVPDMAHPLFYCKQDGSLNNGVELVSHPGTRKWWDEQRGAITDLLTRVSRAGWRSHEVGTCGMHVHISQSSFENSMHIYRFLHLLYRYPALSLLVSQRNRARLNQWATLSYKSKPALKRKADLRLKNREWERAESGGHYDGVHKTSETFELRIFNGTLNPHRFYKNLQFAWATLAFTADTLNLRHITAARFTAWVAAHAEQYPDLAAFFAEHRSHSALAAKRVA